MKASAMLVAMALALAIAVGVWIIPVGASAPQAAARVTMTNGLEFVPETVSVQVGDTVEWENTSDIVHTVTADPDKAADPDNVNLPEGAEPFDSGDMMPGDTFSQRFTVPGRYEYVCLPHESAGMLGTVIVEE